MNNRIVNVHIGEVKVSRCEHKIQTLLGSCIGIAFLWPSHRVFGLAHCLLPRTPKSQDEQPRQRRSTKCTGLARPRRPTFSEEGIAVGEGRYVDQAIESLCRLMHITRVRDIRAVVAGGANMIQPSTAKPEKMIGYMNAQNAIEQLQRRKISVIDKQTGGTEGRCMSVNCETGVVTIKSIPRYSNR